MSDHVEKLHGQLIDRMTASGSLRTEPWKRAAEAVPRHEFLRGGFFRRVPGTAAWAPVLEGDEDWLTGCHADESLVTQIAGTIVPTDIHGEIMREPTSFSTLPSLVLRMLEDLQVDPGANVLEIGTGTGYSSVVLCARLGEEHATSVEYDKDVAARARGALGRLQLYPTLITGDGLLGHGGGAPYDRVIATCGLREIPAAWIEQTRPGGLILATVGGWLGSSELACLTVHEDGTASGPLLGGAVSFHARAPTDGTPARPPPRPVDHEAAGLVVQYIRADDGLLLRADVPVPSAQRLTLEQDGRVEHVLIDAKSGARAAVYEDGGRWMVRHDDTDIWDAVEEQLGRWRVAGAPALTEFTVNVTPKGQTITW